MIMIINLLYTFLPSGLLTMTTSRSFTVSEGKENGKKKPVDIHRQIVYKASNGLELSQDQLKQMTIFQKKQVSRKNLRLFKDHTRIAFHIRKRFVAVRRSFELNN